MKTFTNVLFGRSIGLSFTLFIPAKILKQALSKPGTKIVLMYKISKTKAYPKYIRYQRDWPSKSGGRAKTFGELPENGLFLIKSNVERILENQSEMAVNGVPMLCLYAKNQDGTYRTALGDTTHCEKLSNDLPVIPVHRNTLQKCRWNIATFSDDTEVVQFMTCDGI